MSLLTILTAEPNAGKTTVALALAGRSRAVWLVPTHINKNKGLKVIPWQFLNKVPNRLLLPTVKKFGQVRFVIDDENAELITQFMAPSFNGLTFIFDDMPAVFFSKRAQTIFAKFASGIRHREGRIIITTQRIKGVISPFARAMADEIIQVGPLVAEDEARALYTMGGGAKYAKFNDFYAEIRKNKKYHAFKIK